MAISNRALAFREACLGRVDTYVSIYGGVVHGAKRRPSDPNPMCNNPDPNPNSKPVIGAGMLCLV